MPELKDSRILVTGGAGFVGSHVVEQLGDCGAGEIMILDNLIRGSRHNIERALAGGRAQFIEGDIRDTALLDQLLMGMDYCIHLAALRITHCAAQPRDALTVMYDGTFNVLEGCVKHRIKKMVLASTASVYGQAEEFPTREDHHPYHNVTLYGAAKMANELMCRSFVHMHGLAFNALRYFNIYGPRMDVHGKYTEVLVRWYRLIREGKPPVIFGDGSQTMDFIDVEDVARATVTALASDTDNEVFNIASGRETSLAELCRLLLEVMGSDLQPQFQPLPGERKKVEVQRRLADVTKARHRLGFQAQVDLREGLSRLVGWLDEHQEGA